MVLKGFGTLAIMSFFMVPMSIHAQIQPGCHLMTHEEQAGLLAMGADIPANGQICDKDKPLLYGGCTENPYPYLQAKNKTGRPDSVSGLNSDFACRFSKFLKAADAAGMNIAIASGYRSIAHQTSLYNAYIGCGKCGAPVAPPGKSKHNIGLAVDLSFNGQRGPTNTAQCMANIPQCKWAHTNYAQFGLRYPMEYEPWHIEPSGNVSGKPQPLPEGGGDWISDDTGTTYSGAPAPFSTPLSSMMRPFQSQSVSAGTSVPAAVSTGAPIPNTPVTPAATTNTTYPYSLPSGTSTWSPSSIDLIKLMASGTSTTGQSVLTATSVQLNANLGDITIGGTNSNIAMVPSNTMASTSVIVNPIHVTETFTGGVNAQTSGNISALDRSFLLSVLDTMKSVLISIIKSATSGQTYGFSGAWQTAQSGTSR